MYKNAPPAFDEYANSYDKLLNAALAASGESKMYFARERMVKLRHCVMRLNIPFGRVLDFGCGTGTSIPLFFDILGANCVTGVDVSRKSLEIARTANKRRRARFCLVDEFVPRGEIDVVFMNGVLHHIPSEGREAMLRCVSNSLAKHGVLALFENNPWNPGARWCMYRNPFDRGAVLLSLGEAQQLLRRSGFNVILWNTLFFFPRYLSMLRMFDCFLRRVPLGAQYFILAGRRV